VFYTAAGATNQSALFPNCSGAHASTQGRLLSATEAYALALERC